MNKENFDFKKRGYDFIVEEILPFELSGKGDVLFVYFEKINMNTMDVVEYLSSHFDISKNSLGIGGLKDKDAVTRQWICVYKSILSKIGGEKMFVNVLSQVVKIMKTAWHDKTLNLLDDIKNKFYIRLRGTKTFSQVEKDSIRDEISQIMESGVPNYFGIQRFGVNFRNINMGKDILVTKKSLKNKFETKFKLQSYGSYLFNRLLDIRKKIGDTIMDGDIVRVGNGFGYYDQKSNRVKVFEKNKNKDFFHYPENIVREVGYDPDKHQVTLPLFGFNTLLCLPHTQAGKLEESFMEKYNINQKNLEIFETLSIFGLRRNSWLKPSEYTISWTGDDLIISFVLGKGSYASVIIDQFFED